MTVKKITMDFLKANSACSDGKDYYKSIGEPKTLLTTVKQCMNDNEFGYANWLITRCLDRDDKTRYAIFAAEQVLSIYENKYPDDKRPRNAIEAAKEYLSNQTEENKEKVKNAADAAYAADAAAANAAYAVYAAAYAAYAAYAAAYAADAAANAKQELRKQIINYGLQLAGYKKGV